MKRNGLVTPYLIFVRGIVFQKDILQVEEQIREERN